MRRFAQKHGFQERYNVASRLLKQYPDRVPIICEPSDKPNINFTEDFKTKYIVPRDITVGKFLLTIRYQLKIQPEEAVFIFVNNSTFPPTSSLIGSIYERHKSSDNFLYLIICGENTFG